MKLNGPEQFSSFISLQDYPTLLIVHHMKVH